MEYCVLFLLLFTATTTRLRTCTAVCRPGAVKERGVSASEKPEIVKIHNYFRRQNALGNVTAQPKASNMLKLTWDESLAQKAQQIAETCEFRHVKVKDPRFLVGQNLYTSYTSENKQGADWNRGVKSWFDEYKTYQFGKRVFNHYTQVVWGNTNKIGCGYVKYNQRRGFQRLYVCHYGPSGNMKGQAPYAVGKGCEHLCDSSQHVTTARPGIVKPKPTRISPQKRPMPTRKPKPEPTTEKPSQVDAVVKLLLYLIAQRQAEQKVQQTEIPVEETLYYEEAPGDEYHGQSEQPYYEDEYDDDEQKGEEYDYYTEYPDTYNRVDNQLSDSNPSTKEKQRATVKANNMNATRLFDNKINPTGVENTPYKPAAKEEGIKDSNGSVQKTEKVVVIDRTVTEKSHDQGYDEQTVYYDDHGQYYYKEADADNGAQIQDNEHGELQYYPDEYYDQNDEYRKEEQYDEYAEHEITEDTVNSQN